LPFVRPWSPPRADVPVGTTAAVNVSILTAALIFAALH